MLFVVPTTLVAQYTSRLGRFQVDQKRGCAPFTINITSLIEGGCTETRPCIMDFLGSPPPYPTNKFEYTYDSPGTYTLTVYDNSQNPTSDDITITVDPDIQPDFELYSCSSNGVSIRITDTNYQEYFVDFGDGSPVVTVPASANPVAQHSYASAGNFNVSVRGEKNNAAPNCTPRVKVFQAIDPLQLPAPSFTQLRAVNESTIDLSFPSETNILYRLEIAQNSTNFQLYQPMLYGVNSFTVTNLRLADNYYCFRLDSYDDCKGAHTYSPIICSQKVNLSIQNGLNKFNWQTSDVGVTTFDVIRNQTPYSLNVPMDASSFSDTDIDCKKEYCYQVVTNYSHGAKSFSLEQCGISFVKNTPTAPASVSSVVNNTNTQVSLTWDQDPLFTATEYSIYKSMNQNAFFLSGKVTQPAFTDTEYTFNNPTCYKLSYLDKCGNISGESTPACPIRLSYSLSPANEVILNWTNYVGWTAGVQNYTIEKFDVNGSLIATFTVSGTTLTDGQIDNQNQIVGYKVTANPNHSGLISSTSNVVEIYKPVNLFFPTAFTPDGKGPPENEAFFVGGQFISKIELSVFDRWGSLVFYSDKNEPWDGTRAGQPMPIATYVWRATVTDVSGRTSQHNGTVVLIRK
jgi:gliding motility-associated-like protein